MIAELASGGYLFDCQSSDGWVPFSLSKTTFSVAILPSSSYIGHTDLDMNTLQGLGVGSACILHTLVRVMNLWCRVPG